MKKLLSVILSATMVITSSIIAFADKASPILESSSTFYINNMYTDITVLNSGDIDVVPITKLCDLLGYEINTMDEWNYTITKGEDCKNSLGTTEKIEFAVGDQIIKTYNAEGTLSEVDMMTTTVTQITKDSVSEIYIPPFDVGRIFDLKLQYTGDHKIGFLTRDYIADARNDAAKVRGTIFVKSFDGEMPRIEVDGEVVPFTAAPFIDENGRTQVPVREFCDFMNMSIMWFEDPQRVSISSCPPQQDNEAGGGCGGASYWFVIGENRCRRNGTYYNIDTAAQIIDGKTYIPLKYLAEMINYNIAFNPSSPSLSEIGYGYTTMLSYLDLDKNFVLRELGLTDKEISSDDGNYYTKGIDAPIGKRTAIIRFSDDKLLSFAFAYGDKAQADKIMSEIRAYLIENYGEPYISEIEDIKGIDEIPGSFRDDEYGSYFNDWDIELNGEKKTLELQYDHAPEGYFVHITLRSNIK